MNERIFELAEQAYEETHRAMGSTCLQEAFDDFYTEKFAELIVKECAKNAVLFADSTTVQGLPNKYIENYMLKHFGVRE